MAINFTQAVQDQVANSTATYYTATNKKLKIDKATGFNSDGSAATLDVWIVPSGGTAGDGNKIIEGKSILSGATEILYELEGHIIPSGSTLQASSGTNDAITLTISGFEISI